MQNIILQKRDRDILNFLRNNGFATFSQLRTKFFVSDSTASMRLNALVRANVISKAKFCDLLKEHQNSNFIPGIIEIAINSNAIVFRLSSIFQDSFTHSSKVSDFRMLVHQLILNEISIYFERQMPGSKAIVDLETWQKLSSIGNSQPLLPDLIVESNENRIAVELERTTKSKIEYITRMTRYSQSNFTHVLFYYTNDRQLELFMSVVGPFRKIGFVNYFDCEHVFSKYFGKISLQEFLNLSSRFGKLLTET